MKFLFLIFLAFSALAQTHFDGLHVRDNKGMITVLEAPLFYEPDDQAPVVQYVRKGEEIYIHPAEFAMDRYEGIITETQEEVDAYGEVYSKDYKDPLFKEMKDAYRPERGSRFYKTMAANGKDAYILKEHVFLLYEDSREIGQNVADPDPTDYRIAEPLPKGYPIERPSGERTQVNFALGTPAGNAYPYNEKINDIGYGFYKELVGMWGKNVDAQVTDRFFFGGLVALSHFEAEYQLKTRETTERNFKLSAGPMASYDFWRNESYRLNLSGSIQFVFLDLVDIEQRDDSETDSRSFRSYYLAPRIGLSFEKPKVFEGLDLIIGSRVSWEVGHEYTTTDDPEINSWWEGDKFSRNNFLQITYFLGLQKSI